MENRLSPRALELLDDLVQASRALGADPSLVLHGGGNTSVKATWQDITGDELEVLFIKGSGHDLATIGRVGFAPLRLERLRQLLPPVKMGDLELGNELRAASLDAKAPNPSVETLVHALVPHAAVLHSHADAVLAITNTEGGRAKVEELYGDRVVIVDYVMPGPDLGEACFAAWQEQAHEGTEGIVVLNHGLFAVGDTPSEALVRHEQMIAEARALLGEVPEHEAQASATTSSSTSAADQVLALAELRAAISGVAGKPLVMRRRTDGQVSAFLTDPVLRETTQQGPMTPDHVLYTKRTPLMGRDVAGFAAAYEDYFAAHKDRRGLELTMLDPAPRVVLDDELGMLSLGRTARETGITEDIYSHTLDTIELAQGQGGYVALPAGDIFDLEYWVLEQLKLKAAGKPKPLEGQVALVTGAASGIGRACAQELMAAGAAVAGWDLAADTADAFTDQAWLGLTVDVTDPDQVQRALAQTVERFGGVDIVVISAGIFPQSQDIADLTADQWRKTMAVNVDSVAALFSAVHPLLALAPSGARVAVVSSKNVPAPGKGAAAYSTSKAALTQLCRVAALEWAPDGIRVNTVHPDAVFDTGLWTPELLASRAEHYGMSVEDYKRRNLLSAEVTSRDVARMVRAMVDDTFACTTGAQVAVDGGSERTL
ncbi:bifunctional aldolase/short-chain dehydrogenase [Ornithinimicrobium faecis]|uniref:Bifunctional aldolase/short-chain dehydrogenase n=1 Tax=Ornithinimicrobium faecis TaxID=2934158 RepID=A0ABY4YRA9_9MICO|nr:bifunctional aldolase/short-chain dehydrogenase [Ornithinimicrobium sp. HY1793]USQ79127.1 bifunctional aldolase/short-chain dehydrogenase [Ornithinimicrobium sp. HY1793]